MFEPKTFWEKRTALLEDAFATLCESIGADALVSQHRNQIEVLKLAEADRMLGPVDITDASATYERTGQLLVERFKNIGLVYHAPEEGDDESVPTIPRENILLRVNSLPSLDDAMGPDLATAVYRVEMADGTVVPALVIKKALQVYVFSVGEDGIYPVAVSLKNMPADFTWNTEDKLAWRSEIFRYRQDLTFSSLTDRLDNSLVALDFTAVDAEYVLWAEQAEKERVAREADLKAAEDFINTPPATVEAEGTEAAAAIVADAAANDDSAAETADNAEGKNASKLRGLDSPIAQIDDAPFERGENPLFQHVDEAAFFAGDADVTVDESGLEAEVVEDGDVEVDAVTRDAEAAFDNDAAAAEVEAASDTTTEADANSESGDNDNK